MRPTARASGQRRRARAVLLPLVGILLTLGAWQLVTSYMIGNPQFSAGFAPGNSFRALVAFLTTPSFLRHAVPSLARVGIGLSLAIAVGIPLGVLIGYSQTASLTTNAVFQFVRMTSPLAWMPIAIILFGVGDRPVFFLIAVAAVWPIMLSTAHGVRKVDPIWIRVVRMLGADRRGVLRRAVVPAIMPDILTGIRISIGISWIILVPAEMLGVSSGLGYYILDARDRFDYSELMAIILVVGFLGFLSDGLVRLAQQHFFWVEELEGGLSAQ